MQPFFLLSLLSSALSAPKRPRQQPMFVYVAPRRPGRWPSFLASLVIHLFLVLLIPAATDTLTDPYERESWQRQEKLLRTLRIRIPEQLYIASSGPTPPTAAKQKKEEQMRALKQALAAHAQQAATKARRGRPPGRKRRFELPDLVRRDSDQSIVQPRYSADMVPSRDLQLPEMFFWAPPMAQADLAKAFVQPGHSKTPTQTRTLDADPRLQMPYSELTTLTLATQMMALFAPQDAMPIRTAFPEQPSKRTGISADPLSGDPANVLSISSDPLPLRELLTVPPGNQVGRTPNSGNETNRWAGGTGHSDQGAGSNGPGGGTGTKGNASAGSSTTATDSQTQQASAEVPGGSETGIPSDGSPEGIARSAAVQATRLDHPTGGVFDVVVQSSGVESFPESAGYLSGSPIYSVYVGVGAEKEWVLQYCTPAGEEGETIQVSGPVVHLPQLSRLVAPYPRITFRPPVRSQTGKHVMVYGFITAEGRFQDLRVLGTGDPQENAAIVAVLEQWQFRPAMRREQPVRVEILLAIPAE